jgi:hypothetical protein
MNPTQRETIAIIAKSAQVMSDSWAPSIALLLPEAEKVDKEAARLLRNVRAAYLEFVAHVRTRTEI